MPLREVEMSSGPDRKGQREGREGAATVKTPLATSPCAAAIAPVTGKIVLVR